MTKKTETTETKKTYKFTCGSCGSEVETNDEYAPATCLTCIDKETEMVDNEIKEPEVK
jgi:DNA-directed RNA polymerase subunit RPC12/RpoP